MRLSAPLTTGIVSTFVCAHPYYFDTQLLVFGQLFHNFDSLRFPSAGITTSIGRRVSLLFFSLSV